MGSLKHPLVSVVIPTLNRPAELGQALASIAGQRNIDLVDVEVIVVNDGGTPTEHAITEARCQGLAVAAITHRRRRGLPRARNTGLEVARGRYVALLDDDDVFLPCHLATALVQLTATEVDGVVTSCLLAEVRIDPTADTITGVVEWEIGFDPNLLEACNLVPVHAVVFRRPETARFDPTLPALEDWDFWLRLTREHRYRLARLYEPTVIYHRIPQTASMIAAVVEGAAAMAEFSALVRQIWRRWPASTARSGRFRSHIAVMYWHLFGRLARNEPINPHYYLDSVRQIQHAWLDPTAEASLVERLAQAVERTTANDRHAA